LDIITLKYAFGISAIATGNYKVCFDLYQFNLLWNLYTPKGSCLIMAQAGCPLANSCEHNSSYSFQWMVLKPSRIVTHRM